jgi:uncharacterized membrane protein
MYASGGFFNDLRAFNILLVESMLITSEPYTIGNSCNVVKIVFLEGVNSVDNPVRKVVMGGVKLYV